jgi:hypothetical protein
MTDTDIRNQFKNTPYLIKIVKFGDLDNYKTLLDLLPHRRCGLFILFEENKNKGHWCLLSRNNMIIEFFDSYGFSSDEILKWNSIKKRIELDQLDNEMRNLIVKTNFKFVRNKIPYQDRNDLNIATCGRHCCLRLKTIFDKNYSKKQYHQMMLYNKGISGMNYDEIVCDFINFCN